MKVLGIVAEYNPFHNGHLYHLEESMRVTGATHSVAVMSGNFMQRGEPSIVNKWARAEMAIKAGVDLVIELPVVYACRSAEAFAMGALNILDGIGTVNCICFGSESGDLHGLEHISAILAEEPEGFKDHLKTFLSKGQSFPSARGNALEKYLGPSAEGLRRLLLSPNNILAIEYLKAIKRLGSRIEAFTIKRFAADYHSTSINSSIAGASAIRKQILKRNSLTKKATMSIPKTTSGVLKRELVMGRGPVYSDRFSLPVIAEIRKLKGEDLKKYPEVTEGLENRILSAARENITITDMLKQIKTKRYTHTRIRRISTYIMLGIYKDLLEQLKQQKYPCYARVLALNTKGREILKKANDRSCIPIITKASHYSFGENSPLPEIFQRDILATDLYVMGYFNGEYAFAGQDFVTSPVYL